METSWSGTTAGGAESVAQEGGLRAAAGARPGENGRRRRGAGEGALEAARWPGSACDRASFEVDRMRRLYYQGISSPL